MNRRFIDTHLGNVHVVTMGDDAAPPIVLLHQTPRSTDEFAEVMPILAEDLFVIALDTPGYGASDHPQELPTIADYAACVVDVLDGLDIERADVCGHHTGALTAMELGAAHPDRTAKTILSGPVWVDEAWRTEYRDRFVQWWIADDGTHLSELWERLWKWTTPDASLTERLVVDVLRAGETSEYGHWACLEYDMEPRVALMKGPTKVLVATEDPFLVAEDLQRLVDMIPNAEMSYVDGSVFVTNQNPKGFAAEILSYLV